TVPGGAAHDGRERDRVVRRGRHLALLAPTLGSAMLVWDLHTPLRFMNMFRIFKPTSPMSIGTYILTGFSLFSGVIAGAQAVLDRARPGSRAGRMARGVARVAQIPAAAAGAGLGTYTAALLAATSTPLWAADPAGLAVRFGSSSVAAGAAALSLGAGRRLGRRLDEVMLAALAVELAATLASHRTYERKGVAPALDSPAGRAERVGATVLGTMLPIGLLAASLTARRRLPALSAAASVAAIAGSATLRIAFMAAGDESARRPEVSFRFAQPDNLPGA
ncbi:MAG: NrfD/PsrC family molybdoenzyme membrane anchor subunit, partial [Janthinobacterium lividum]